MYRKWEREEEKRVNERVNVDDCKKLKVQAGSVGGPGLLIYR